MTWLLVKAPALIPMIYGPKWISAIPLVQILALAAIGQSVGSKVGWIFLSQGRTDVLFKLSILTTSVVAIAFAVGLRWSVEGVAIACTIATYLLAYPVLTIAFRLVGLKLRHFLAKLRPIILATGAFGIIAFLLRISLERLGNTQDVTIVVIVTAASLLSYSLFFFVVDRELFTETVRALAELQLADR
jgi:PST family polysaccharide transporter